MLLLAIRDAQAGDQEAAEWLETTGGVWAELFLGIEPEVFARWPASVTTGRLFSGPHRKHARRRSRRRTPTAAQAPHGRAPKQPGKR